MNELLIRVFFGAVIAVWITAFTHAQRRNERAQKMNANGKVYAPMVTGYLLYIPLWLVIVPILNLLLPFLSEAQLYAEFLTVVLTLTVYYMLLLPLSPLLRKRLSPVSCGALWMLPNTLYIVRGFLKGPELPRSIPLAERTVLLIGRVWLAGFGLILVYKLLEHLFFRRRVLRDAAEIGDEAVLTIWEEAQDALGWRRYRLLRSPGVQTPLSIGFFTKTICVLLPERNYTAPELRLIFRHELIHIQREDCFLKFTMLFCCAMCWFNPLMWLAMRRCAEDVELACDESVTERLDASARRRYAELLLTTAGDARGFSSCLSASAMALRYRLQGVLRPGNRRLGSVFLGLCCFLLLVGFGLIQFSVQ